MHLICEDPINPLEDPWGSANPALKSAAISHAPDLLPEDYDSFPTCNKCMLLKQKYAFGIDLNYFFLFHYYSLQNWTNSWSYRHPIKKNNLVIFFSNFGENFTKALPRFKPKTIFLVKNYLGHYFNWVIICIFARLALKLLHCWTLFSQRTK